MGRQPRKPPAEQESEKGKRPPATNRAFFALLKILHLSQQQAAELFHLKPGTLSDYAQGRKTLLLKNYRRKCEKVGLDPAISEHALALVAEVDGALEPQKASAPFLVSEIGRLAVRLASSVPARVEELSTQRDLRQLQTLWKQLKKLETDDWKLLFDQLPELRRWAFVKLLGEESARAASDDAKRALGLADLALWLAERVPGEAGRRSRIFAWAFTANARRVGSDLDEAKDAFAQSISLRKEDDSSELPEAWRLFDLEASLRIGLREYPEALLLLDQAAELAPPSGAIQARLLSQRACILELLEDSEGAVALLQRAASLLDRSAELHDVWMLRFNLMTNLCKVGRADEAHAMLSGLRSLAAQIGNRIEQFRLRWLEGKIAAGLGRIEEAIEALSFVRSAFNQEEIRYDEALASMELAGMYLEQKRTADVKKLVRQMQPVFRDKDIPEEAQKALDLFRRAVELETVTVELVRRVVTYLYRAQNDPTLRFEETA